MTGTAAAFALGVVIGTAYCAALWRSLAGLAERRRPVARLLWGAALRVGLLSGAFYLVMDGSGPRLVACCLGFVAARIVVTRWLLAQPSRSPG